MPAWHHHREALIYSRDYDFVSIDRAALTCDWFNVFVVGFLPLKAGKPQKSYRRRIRQFSQHGAIVDNIFRPSITHLLVPKGWTRTKVLEHLELKEIPPGMQIIRISWASHCIEKKRIVDPDRRVHLVPDNPVPKPMGIYVQKHFNVANEQVDQTITAVNKPIFDENMAEVWKRYGRPTINDNLIEKSVASEFSEVKDTHSGLKPHLSVVDERYPDTRVADVQKELQAKEQSFCLVDQHVDNCEEFDELILQNKMEQVAKRILLNREEREALECPSEPEVEYKPAEPTKSNVTVPSPPQRSKKVDWMTFACVNGRSKNMPNPNDQVITLFSMMSNYYHNIGEEWRSQAYRKAVQALKKQKTKITTAAEARKVPGIGERLSIKLEEIVDTGHLQRLDDARGDDADAVLSTLLKIYGVGPETARRWYTEGVRSLDDVVKREDLTPQQKVGLERFDDFNKRMPRDVVTKHYDIVKNTLSEIDPEAEAHVMGSYRRGQQDCGDIDIIITKKDADMTELEILLRKILDKLFMTGFLKCTLSGSNGMVNKWLGASALPDDPTWRRIDFLPVPWSELGAAFIYFTGNDLFNRSLRLLANRKGYRLNQKGLYIDAFPKRAGQKRVDFSQEDMVESHDERKIFDILGVPFRDPQDRNVG